MEEKPENEANSQFVIHDSQDDSRASEYDIDQRTVLSTAAFRVPSDIQTHGSYGYKVLQNMTYEHKLPQNMAKTLQALNMGIVLMIALCQVC